MRRSAGRQNAELATVPDATSSVEPSARGGLLLAYAAVDEHEIRRGVQALAPVLRDCRTPEL